MQVELITPKEWKNPQGVVKHFVELTLDGRIFSCWQPVGLTVKVGDTVEGEVIEKGAGKTPQIRIKSLNGVATEGSKGGGKAGDPKSFACSYAKDVLIACLSHGLPLDSKQMDGTLEHYYAWFLSKMEG